MAESAAAAWKYKLEYDVLGVHSNPFPQYLNNYIYKIFV
jgi:hypothetical protein